MKHILLIEDNEEHAELIERSLQKGFRNIHMELAATPDEAYRTLKKKNFDLILTDYYLPATNSDDHIRELSKIAPHIPLVVITGQGDEKAATRSIQLGAEDYIVKTRDTLEALPEILQRAILKHRSHQKKRSLEVKKHLEGHRRKFKKVLGKVENIGRQLQDLQKTTTNPETKPEAETTSTMEHFNKQITMLKEFVGKLLKRNE